MTADENVHQFAIKESKFSNNANEQMHSSAEFWSFKNIPYSGFKFNIFLKAGENVTIILSTKNNGHFYPMPTDIKDV